MAPEHRRLEIVARHPPDVSPVRQRVEVERHRAAASGRLPRGIDPAVRFGGARPRVAGVKQQAGAVGSGGSRSRRSPRPQPSASGAPLRKNGTSLPSRAANWSSSCRGTAPFASRLTAMQCRGGIARTAAQPGPHRNALGERQVYAEAIAGRVEHQLGGADRQVALGWPDVRTFDVDRDRLAVAALDLKRDPPGSPDRTASPSRESRPPRARARGGRG